MSCLAIFLGEMPCSRSSLAVAVVAVVERHQHVLEPDAVDELAHQQPAGAHLGVDARRRGAQLLALLEVGAEQLLVAGLDGEVELLEQHLPQLGAEGAADVWPQQRQALHRAQHQVEGGEIGLEPAHDARSAYLHRHHVAVPQPRLVDAGHRGAAHRREVEEGEDLLDRAAELLADHLAHVVRGDRRHLVEQLVQGVAVGRRQDVGADGELLADLDVSATEPEEHPPQPCRTAMHQPHLAPLAVAAAQPIQDQPVEEARELEVGDDEQQLDEPESDAEDADADGLALRRRRRGQHAGAGFRPPRLRRRFRRREWQHVAPADLLLRPAVGARRERVRITLQAGNARPAVYLGTEQGILHDRYTSPTGSLRTPHLSGPNPVEAPTGRGASAAPATSARRRTAATGPTTGSSASAASTSPSASGRSAPWRRCAGPSRRRARRCARSP